MSRPEPASPPAPAQPTRKGSGRRTLVIIALVAIAIAAVLYSTESVLAIRNGWYFSWRTPFLFALRDLMLPAIYVDAWLLDDFVWRGNAMSVREEERPST